MADIPVTLEEEIIQKIDQLVKSGVYHSRNEAIRSMVNEKLKALSPSTIVPESEEQLIKQLLEILRDEKGIIFNFTSPKTAAELVAEGRER